MSCDHFIGVSAHFVTEYMPRALSKNVRLPRTPLDVLHLFWASFSPPACQRLGTLTTHALHLHHPVNRGEKRAARLQSKYWFKARCSREAVGALLPYKSSEIVILHCTNSRGVTSHIQVNRNFSLYTLRLSHWEAELLERSVLMISLLNYVNDFKLSHSQNNTHNSLDLHMLTDFNARNWKPLKKSDTLFD